MALAPRPTVDITARDTGDRLQPERTNEALQLASALAEVAPEAQQFAAQYAAQEQSKAAAQARTDALRTSGVAFKDAVDQGLIRRDQNPWYMSAYHKEAAQVSAQTRLSALQEEAQTWEERGDTAQFQDRLNREVGEIGATYKGEEEQVGFNAAAAPMLQQTAAANTARNVALVNQQRTANAGTLAAQAIATANTNNGGNATPAQIRDSLVDQREEFINTGGTPLEWDNVVIQAVTSAAYASDDPDLLNVLKGDELGNLYARPEVAGSVSSDQYRIRQAADDRINAADRQRRAQAKAEGDAIRPQLIEQYGEALFTGDIDPVAIFRQYREQGVSFDGIQSAIADITRDVQTTQSLQTARLRANGLSGGTEGLDVIRLASRAQRDPLTPQLQADIEQAYVRGDITQDDATRWIGQAQTNGEQAQNKAEVDARRGAREGAQSAGAYHPRNMTQMNQRLSQLSATTSGLTRNAGVTTVSGDGAEKVAKSAAEAWLGVRPGDYDGALNAGANALARWGRAQISIAARTRARSAAPRPRTSTGNSR